jgi:hypothetical protein
MNGLITDLNVAENGSAVLVSTTPNADIDGSQAHYLLNRFSAAGKKQWSLDTKGPIKYQNISKDGNFIMVAVYDEKLSALNAKGKVIWSKDTICRPMLLERSKQIVCYHDDDSEPTIAFDVFTWQGKPVTRFPIHDDVLALKISGDESHLALALTKGQLLLLGADFKTIWKHELKSEIVDIAVSSEPLSVVAAVTADRHFYVFSVKGDKLVDTLLDNHAEAVESYLGGKHWAVYGNGTDGQFISLFDTPTPLAKTAKELPKTKPLWMKHEDHYGEFSPPLGVDGEDILVGLETFEQRSRLGHFIALDGGGSPLWQVSFAPEIASYLYAVSGKTVAISTDEGTLSVYSRPVAEIQAPPPAPAKKTKKKSRKAKSSG